MCTFVTDARVPGGHGINFKWPNEVRNQVLYRTTAHHVDGIKGLYWYTFLDKYLSHATYCQPNPSIKFGVKKAIKTLYVLKLFALCP